MHRAHLVAAVLLLGLFMIGCAPTHPGSAIETRASRLDRLGLAIDQNDRAVAYDFAIQGVDSALATQPIAAFNHAPDSADYGLIGARAFGEVARDYLTRRFAAISPYAPVRIRIVAHPYELGTARQDTLTEDLPTNNLRINGATVSGPERGDPVWTARSRGSVYVEIEADDQVVVADTLQLGASIRSYKSPENRSEELGPSLINRMNEGLLMKLHFFFRDETAL